MFVQQIYKQVGIFNGDFSESCQFTKYTKGQFYDWHCDSWPNPYNRENTNDPSHGKIRKLICNTYTIRRKRIQRW